MIGYSTIFERSSGSKTFCVRDQQFSCRLKKTIAENVAYILYQDHSDTLFELVAFQAITLPKQNQHLGQTRSPHTLDIPRTNIRQRAYIELVRTIHYQRHEAEMLE